MDHRQVEPLHRAADVILPAVQQRADLGDARAVQIRHRLEAADAPLEEQIHQQRFDGIVVVMPQCDLVDPPLRQRRIQAAPPQLGAEGAGVLFFALFKYDLVYRHMDAGVRDLQLPAQLRHGVKAHARRAGLQRDGLQLKGDGIEVPQPGQSRQGQQAVLAAGDAHGHLVPGLDHVIVLHAAADLS